MVVEWSLQVKINLKAFEAAEHSPHVDTVISRISKKEFPNGILRPLIRQVLQATATGFSEGGYG
jgi:hypothetical protein